MVPIPPKARRGPAGRQAVPFLDADSLKTDANAWCGEVGGGAEQRPRVSISPSAERARSMGVSEDNLTVLDHPFDQAFAETKMIVAQAPRQVLVSVLHSLLDDYADTLLGPVNARLEMAVNRASLTSPMNPGTGGVRTPHHVQVISPRASNTPTPSHRKGRPHKNKEEEQEMCSVHHSMRALKHLQLNPATGSMECIHGFHCLVDTPTPHTTESPHQFSILTSTPTPTPTPKTSGLRYTEEGTGSSTSPPPPILYNVQQLHQFQRQQQHELLQLQHDHLQFSSFPVSPEAFGHIGSVPFALPTLSPAVYVDPSPRQPSDVSPLDDEYGMVNSTLNDFVNSLGDAE